MMHRGIKPKETHMLPGPQWHPDFRFTGTLTNAMRNFNSLMEQPQYGSSAAYGYALRSSALGAPVMNPALTAFYGNDVAGKIIKTFNPSGNDTSGLNLVLLHRILIKGQVMTSQGSTATTIKLPFPDDKVVT